MNSNCQWSFTRVQSQALPLIEQTPVCDPPNQGYESGPRIQSQAHSAAYPSRPAAFPARPVSYAACLI